MSAAADDVAQFLGFAFRNVELPALTENDLASIASGLDQYAASARLRASAIGLAEHAGEFDPKVFAEIGVPVAAVFRSIGQLRGLLENGATDVSAPLIDAAFLQAHMLGVADIIAHSDEAREDELIARFAGQLRNTVPMARLL